MLERRDCERGDRPVSVASIRGPAYTAPGKLWARASFTVRSWSAGETSSANRASPSAASMAPATPLSATSTVAARIVA